MAAAAALLAAPGAGRALAETILRRVFTALLDSGEISSAKRASPIADLAARVALVVVLGLALVAAVALGVFGDLLERARAALALTV